MIVSAVLIKLLVTDSRSLKERRAVVNSLKQRMKNKFNLSIAELDGGEKLNYCEIGIAAVGSESRLVEETVSKAVNFIESDMRVEVFDVVRIV